MSHSSTFVYNSFKRAAFQGIFISSHEMFKLNTSTRKKP